jgi:hypothetical protein
MSIFKRKKGKRKTFTKETVTEVGGGNLRRYYKEPEETGDSKVKKSKRSGKEKEFYQEDGKTYKKKTTRKGKTKVKEVSSKRFARKLKRYSRKLKDAKTTYHDQPGAKIDPVSGGTREKIAVQTTGSKRGYGQEYEYSGGTRHASGPGVFHEKPTELSAWKKKKNPLNRNTKEKARLRQIHRGYEEE